jgi:FolB domain-containing protein
MTHILRLGALRARTRLGHEQAERIWPQEVLIDVEVELGAAPRACRTDNLADTLCAAQLAAALVAVCETGEHALIEHLAERLCAAARSLAPPGSCVTLGLTKVAPPITGLEGGMTFVITGRRCQPVQGPRWASPPRSARRHREHVSLRRLPRLA